MIKDHVFNCEKCGLCCKKIANSKETIFLDRGDGTCKYYDESNKLCSIYNNRPDICRVDVLYYERYAKVYSWGEYVSINMEVCHSLQENNIIIKS